jgi:Asp-tRNA(Asn)/Glu-tRNA(Gln) amidotransferase A subunit family amidase
LQAFCKLGNLVDATAAVVPFGTYEGGLPRSVQILGPPGSEDGVMALAERLEAVGRVEKNRGT